MTARPGPGGGSSPPPGAGSAGLALLALAYTGLALASTWPLVRHLASRIPLGTLESPTVPFASAWALWWTSDRLRAGLAGYWDAPILHPLRGVFALSEPMPLPGALAAPLFWLGASPALAYNLVVLIALATNGLVGFGLLRSLGLHRLAAGLGGGLLVVLPYSHRELGVLTLVPLAGLLGTLWALLACAREPTPRRVLLLALVFPAAYLVCAQHAYFLLLVGAPASVWLLGRRLLERRLLAAAGAGVIVCAAAIAPLALAQVEARRTHEIERSEEVARFGAATPSSWLSLPWPSLLPSPARQPASGSPLRGLYPGTLTLLLALLGALWGLRLPARRRATALLASFCVLALLLSGLPHLALGGFSPYAWLRDLLPGLAQVRAFYRAGVLAQIALVLLAAQALHALLLSRRGREAAGPTPARRLAVVALAALAVLEPWPTRPAFAETPSRETWRPLLAWIDDHAQPGDALAHLPVRPGRFAREFEDDARWMLLQTAHGRPLFNGYSSYVPRTWRSFAEATGGFPDPRSHATFRSLGVRWVVVRSSWLRAEGRRPPERLWRPVFRDASLDVAVYEVRPVRSRAGPEAGE